jgi:hypothetical protein
MWRRDCQQTAALIRTVLYEENTFYKWIVYKYTAEPGRIE